MAKQWRRVSNSTEGCEVAMKTCTLNGKEVTITIDNFSISPMTIQDYDCTELVIDNDWTNIYSKPIVQFTNYNEGLRYIKDYLNNDYESVRTWLRRNYSIGSKAI